MFDIQSIEMTYIHWLCKKIGVHNFDERTSILIDALYEKGFYWSVPNDEDRAEDALTLRGEFFEENNLESIDENDWPITMLEVLIALARRCDYIMSDLDNNDNTPRWFWEMLTNVGMDMESLNSYEEDYTIDLIDKLLDRILDRTYGASGRGGLFPLNNPEKDQRTVDLWYQMQAYFNDHYGDF